MSNLFSKGCLSHYPNGFAMSRKSMLKIFPAYLRSRKELHSSVFEELHEHRFKNKNLFSKYYTVRFTTQIYIKQSHKMLLEGIPLPSLSLLSKISKGKIGAIKYAQALKKDGKISEDIHLLFDEMYLQK